MVNFLNNTIDAFDKLVRYLLNPIKMLFLLIGAWTPTVFYIAFNYPIQHNYYAWPIAVTVFWIWVTIADLFRNDKV